jgi:hypothetical protein
MRTYDIKLHPEYAEERFNLMDEGWKVMVTSRKAKTFGGWRSCETWEFTQVYPHCYFLYIAVCLLFVASEFLLFALHEGACNTKMLVFSYVFVCLCFKRCIFSLWVCTVCRRWFMMWRMQGGFKGRQMLDGVWLYVGEAKHIFFFKPLKQCDFFL